MVCRIAGILPIRGAIAAGLLSGALACPGVAAVPGEPGPAASDSTLADVRQLIREGRYTQAEGLARQLLAEAQREHGPWSLPAATAMDRVVESLWYSGRTRGTDARDLAEEALAVKEDLLEEDALEIADSLRNLAAVLRGLGEYDEAEAHYRRAIEIREKRVGPADISVARALNDLGNLYWYAEEYAKSIPVFERALTIQIDASGEMDAGVARTLNNLAVMYHEMGDFTRAKELYERALTTREEILEPDHLDLAYTLDGLAQLVEQLGDYTTAYELFDRVLSIRESRFGPDHLHVGWTLNNLGHLCQRMGDYDRALSLWQRALKIETRQLGEEHEDVAMTLGNLAGLHARMGEPERAAELFAQSIRIREKVLGPDRTEVAMTLIPFGALLESRGEREQARVEYERARGILEKTVGTAHPYYATSLQGLAGLAAWEGQDTGEALRLFAEALRINEAALGPDHPQVAGTLSEIAWLRIREGDLSEGLEAALRSEDIARRHLRLTAQALSERQAMGYAAVRDRGLEAALHVALSRQDSETTRRVWDALIRSRAVILDEMVTRRRSTAEIQDPEVVRLREELAAASRKMANLTIRGPAQEPAETYRQMVSAARSEKERIERALAGRSVAFRRDQKTRRTGFEEVADHLPARSALVGYTLCEQPGDGVSSSTRRYAAFVLGPADRRPSVIELGGAEELETSVRRWLREVRRPGSPDADPSLESSYRDAAAIVRSSVWDPVAGRLSGADLVFVVAEGILHQVNLLALPVDEGRYLVETGPRVHYLSAERDLVRLTAPGEGCRGLMAVGGPDYDAVELFDASEPITSARAREGTGTGPARTPGAGSRTRSSCADFRSMRFDALPGSDREIQEIRSLWNGCLENASGDPGAGRANRAVLALTGSSASEVAFKEHVAGHCVVHLATHGFFLQGDCQPTSRPTRGIGSVGPALDLGPVVFAENPLLHSGLALAGANHRQAAGLDGDDGILTAEEIAALDLNGVQWAVLSACDTGTGEIRVGEGVLGLRRAFEVAGARTVIMSLWPVEDDAALRWMRALYRGRLVGELDVTRATREASLGILKEQRERGGSTHPFRWAAFVAAGDWR